MEGTPKQMDVMRTLIKEGFKWDRAKSVTCGGVVLKKGRECWIFNTEGGIYCTRDDFNTIIAIVEIARPTGLAKARAATIVPIFS